MQKKAPLYWNRYCVFVFPELRDVVYIAIYEMHGSQKPNILLLGILLSMVYLHTKKENKEDKKRRQEGKQK